MIILYEYGVVPIYIYIYIYMFTYCVAKLSSIDIRIYTQNQYDMGSNILQTINRS